MVGINQVLNMAWPIVNKSVGTVDDKTRLQALALINDCNKYKMDLTTNDGVKTDAIKYAQNQMEPFEYSRNESTPRYQTQTTTRRRERE
jgi:hypothetical protein